MDKTADKFVTYASGLSYADLTPEAIRSVKRSVIDSIGCAFATFNEEPAKAIRRLASQVTAARPATVIGTRIKTSPELAAFANGCMVRYRDFSDDYFGGTGDTGPHPSDNIGGILAAAESAGADGRALVLGIALAYEVCRQLVDHTSLRAHGWDHPLMHSIATSLGAGRVLGLSREQLGNALSLAVVPNVCLYQTRFGELSNWKSFAGPNGSRNGLFAALLAGEGITGPAEPFEGKAGFMKQLGNPFVPGPFGGRGTPFKIEGTYFKYFPVRYAMQLPVWVALDLRNKVRPEEIESIRVYIEGRSVASRDQFPEFWDPRTRETADHSEPYLIGAALVDGEISDRTFTPQRYRDPAILALIQRISVDEDKEYSAAYPRTFNCRFEATLRSGDMVTVHQVNPRGHPANPMTYSELEEKSLKQMGPLLAEDRSHALLDCLWNLEKVDDLSQLFDLMLI